MNARTLSIIMLALVAMLAGCTTSGSARVYSKGQLRQLQTVQYGNVVSVQSVKVEGNSNDLISMGGAALGGMVGSKVGGGRGEFAGGIVGALAGGFGAKAAQEAINKKDALEITVKLDSGRTVAVVQDVDISFSVNQRVKVLSGGGADRVVPD